MRTRLLHMRRITWPVSRAVKNDSIFWNPRPWFEYLLYNFSGCMMTVIKVISENNARPCVKKTYEFLRMICYRCLECLIAVVFADVDLQYWTSKVEQIVSFTAIFSNICTAHAQKRLFMNFRCKLRHRRSTHWPWISVRVQNVGDFATISVDFCIFYAECPPYFYFRFVWPIDLESIPHASTPTSTIPTKFEAHTPIRSWAMSDNVSRYFLLFYWKCVRGHCACLELRDPCVEGQKNNYIFGIPDPDLPIHYTTFIGRRLRVVSSRAL